MRIVRSERIVLSQNEIDIWIKFNNILSGLARGTQNPNTEKTISEIQDLLNELWEEIYVEQGEIIVKGS